MTRKFSFTPSTIDDLWAGILMDPQTAGLSIEVLPSGKKQWRFRRRVLGSHAIARLTFGLFAANSIAAAREWASALNEKIEAGIDPRVAIREAEARISMTVARVHELYMVLSW